MKGSAAGWKPKVACCQLCCTCNTRALLTAGGMVYREDRRSGVDPAQIFKSFKHSFTGEYFGTPFGLCSAKCTWQSTDLWHRVSILWILKGLDVRYHCCCLYRLDPFIPICCPCVFEATDVIKLPVASTLHKPPQQFPGHLAMGDCHLTAEESALIHNKHIGTKLVIFTQGSKYY